MIHIDLIEKDVKHLATEIYQVTAKIKEDLKNGTVQAAEHYAASIVPEIDPIYQAVVVICDKVLATCALIKDSDWSGVKSRLCFMVAEIVAIKKDTHKSLFGKILSDVQVVLNYLIGK